MGMKMKRKGIFYILLVVFFALFSNLQAAEPLPDTGQTKFYNNSVEISEPTLGAAFYGQDAHYTRERSYTKLDPNGNTLPVSVTTWYQVVDNVTGLIWEVKSDDGSVNDVDNLYSWDDAQSVFIDSLNFGSGYCGRTDWRLPTIKELLYLVDSGQGSPSIDIVYFLQTKPQNYWSSTTADFNTSSAWVVTFGSSTSGTLEKINSSWVRAVRSGQ